MSNKRRRGLIMVVTGNGKGKTTSALGLAFRALGNGFKVFMVQYVKGKWKTGEKKLADLLHAHADHLGLDIEIRPMGDGFTWDTKNREQDIATTRQIWEVSKQAIASGKYDIVLPGRGAPAEICDFANMVSEINAVKHHYKAGVRAQQGIEF